MKRATKKIEETEPTWPNVGDVVNYSSVIGKPPTQFNMVVRSGPELVGGTWCVWLTGKAGCVAIAACTPARTP